MCACSWVASRDILNRAERREASLFCVSLPAGGAKRTITMIDAQDDSSEAEQTIARHRALVEAFEGQRSLTWEIWTAPIYDSKSLTAQGKQVTLQAAATLRRFLGDDFFDK